jgi:hypothetical protein
MDWEVPGRGKNRQGCVLGAARREFTLRVKTFGALAGCARGVTGVKSEPDQVD